MHWQPLASVFTLKAKGISYSAAHKQLKNSKYFFPV